MGGNSGSEVIPALFFLLNISKSYGWILKVEPDLENSRSD